MKRYKSDDSYCGITGKVCYDSDRDVKFAIELSKRRSHVTLSYYRCGYCNKLHLTSKNRQ